MRIAHITDIHIQRRPQLTELFGKRFLGAANLYICLLYTSDAADE